LRLFGLVWENADVVDLNHERLFIIAIEVADGRRGVVRHADDDDAGMKGPRAGNYRTVRHDLWRWEGSCV